MMKTLPKIIAPSVFSLVTVLLSPCSSAQTTVLYSENFNAPTTLGWAGSGDGVGSFSSTIVTSLSNNGFPTAPTSGYLALTANSANKATNAGWWAVQVLTNLSTPNGLGQTNLSKISFTARVRAKGLPIGGAVAILKISAAGDIPGQPTSGYKRITFEPVLLSGNDWVTIGGTFDDAGLQAAQGSRYNFTTTATSYEILVELSGYNQSTSPEYVAYNSPTGPSNGGRKNPGLAPNSAIRVEFDDVLLTVENPAAQTTAIGTVSPKSGVGGSSVTITGVAFGSSPAVSFNGIPASSVSVNGAGTSITAVVPAGATTGKITVVGANATATSAYNFFVTSPTNLLADPNFDTSQSQEFWTYFEGARIITTNNVSPDANLSWNNIPGAQANSPYMFFAGWEGTPYAGFMQESIPFSSTNGDYFTATFQAKFEGNFSAGSTIIAFMDGSTEVATKDITGEIKANQKIDGEPGAWRTYQATFKATPSILSAGRLTLKFQPLNRALTNMGSVFVDQITLAQTNAAAVGPQIAVTLSGSSLTNGATVTVPDALVGFTSSYSLQIANNGAEDLVLSNVTATGGFTLAPATLPITIPYGSFRTLSLKAAPTAAGAFSGSVTIANNDKETADRSFTFTIGSSARPTTENFTSGTPASLGFASQFAGPTTLLGTSTLTVTNGTLRLTLDTSDNNVVESGTSWYYGIQKEFASPGVLDLAATTFQVSLRAFGVYAGTAGLKNKVEVRLESLDAPGGAATGFLQLGLPLDDTGYGAGAVPTFTPDGTYDRVALELGEGGNFVTAGGTVATLAANTGVNSLARAVNGWVSGASTTGTLTPTRLLKTDAPFFRIVVLINQSEFDYDSNNVVEIDSLTFSPGTSAVPVPTLTMANPGFELDSTLGSGAAPVSWAQYPPDGVMKEFAATGAAIYNQAAGVNDATATITAHSGANTMKLRGAYYYDTWGVFIPTRGFVYQEFKDLVAAGESVQLKARLYTASIDPLTGGSKAYLTLKFFDGLYNFLGSQSTEVNSANQVTNVWTEYAVTGTMPSGATIVQAGIEYTQNAGTDNGSVYADTFSIAKVTTTPLSAFDQWVADNSLAGQSFAVVGNRYAFGASRPQVSGVASIPSLSGTTLSYPYDLRNDSTLTVTAQYSTDLVNWNDLPAGFTTNGTGAPTGFTRKLLSVGVGSGGVPTPKSFIRLKVTRTP
jgi:hypothetical protein